MRTIHKVFERTCVSCGKKGNKRDFRRNVIKNGIIVFDEKQVEKGRGFYVCNNENCLKNLSKNKRIFKYFWR